jgi:excisionase family DNA binding protein
MAMEIMARHALPTGERAEAARTAEVLRRRDPADRVELAVIRPDGTSETVTLSAAAAAIIEDVLDKTSKAPAVTLLADDAELSPEDAAAILGISRPLVRRRMDAGVLAFRRVGAHRRLRLSDVLEMKRLQASVQSALEDLRADPEDRGGGG